MNESPKALWDECLALVKRNVSEQQYSTWFQPIVCESYDEDTRTLMLQVQSHMIVEYLEGNFADLLRKVFMRVFRSQIVLKYRVLAVSNPKTTIDYSPDEVDKRMEQKGSGMANKTPSVFDAARNAEFDSYLNPRQTFNNYIEGTSNKLPRTVGLSIAEHPSNVTFNPLFVFGPSGFGKTHLINAIGVRTKQLYPQRRVLYISARLFQVQYTDSVRNHTTNDFINFYQSIDMLIVDDVQKWLTATSTRETFFHIFNHLFRTGKQIILACDRPPVELIGMNERLITRFSCGLIAEIEKPNVQLCIDILKSKMKRDGLSIPDNVVRFIAETANGSVRDLEGAINGLLAYSVVYNTEIDMRLAERVVKRAVKSDDNPLTIDDIVGSVCERFGISADDLNGQSRRREFVVPRQVAMYMAQKYTRMPASRIGKLVGGRDHSTVIHSCHNVEKRISADAEFATMLDDIEKSFKLKG